MPKVTAVLLTAVSVSALILVVGVVGSAQQPAVAPVVPPALTFVPIHPIEPPARPLPGEPANRLSPNRTEEQPPQHAQR